MQRYIRHFYQIRCFLFKQQKKCLKTLACVRLLLITYQYIIIYWYIYNIYNILLLLLLLIIESNPEQSKYPWKDIPDLILRLFLLWKFCSKLVFKLQGEITYHGPRRGDGQMQHSRSDVDALRARRTDRTHSLAEKFLCQSTPKTILKYAIWK